MMAELHIHARSESGTFTEVTAGKHVICIDEPPFFGGGDAAPSPVELLLASLAGAMIAIGRLTATELGLTIGAIEITVDGDCDSAGFFGRNFDQRVGYHAIRVHLTADTQEKTERLERWREQVIRRCPVLDNLTAPVPISVVVYAGDLSNP